jgi:hypothetical protein
MMARRTNEEWRVLLAEQRASGQTQKEWCLSKGISLYTLRDRASRIKRIDREKAACQSGSETVPAGWAEVRPEKAPCARNPSSSRTKAARSSESTQQWAAIPAGLVSAPAAPAGAIQLICGAWTVNVESGFDAGTLTAVLRAVASCC